ncbi:hypothetical protein [Paenibacillus apiarius]|uniref:hypothetical protein n=1 Tax=Paenibacillus apiarius TaxID=46240 RepID=UPI00197DF890|nr:hypothetical protein [Paenibacillus apiarius]MBN3526651.1 hypothetical protein [Paenibacillus apiarius]
MRIEVTNQCFTITDDQGRSISNEWDEVCRVHVYVIDCVLWTNRCIELEFEYGKFAEVHDDYEGWEELVNQLDHYLPITDHSWRERLMNCGPDDKVDTIFERMASNR